MTDATTADILAAAELIEEHKPTIWYHFDRWACEADQPYRGYGNNPTAAVKAWSESAGVPWPAMKVVPMYYIRDDVDDAGFLSVQQSKPKRIQAGWTAVPCEVVIRESEVV